MFVLTWLWRILKSVLKSIVRTIAFAAVLIGVLVGIGLAIGDGLPRNMVLELDLRESMDDKSAPDFLGLKTSKLAIMDVVMGLDAASRDARVKGVLLRVGSGDLSVPKAQELRDAIKRFRTSDKFVIAHSQSFYSGGLGDYVVAAAADQLWMQPVSTFFTTGQSNTTMFFKGVFDKIEATPQFVQRYEYKNAANVFTQTDFTPEHREATLRVLQSWYDSATMQAAEDRAVKWESLITVLNDSPSTVDKVKAEGLITNVGYDDDARQAARMKAGEGANVTRFDRYIQATRNNPRPDPGAQTIALVHAAGDIVEGGDDGALGGTSLSVTGDTFSKAIRDAAADRNVRVILLRVDSPGGSAIASDQILDSIKKARMTGKPIVVSMGSVAASGGYYIAASADRIVAEPGTLTGSIGVLWGKVAVGKTMEKVGLVSRELGVGRDALFLSGITPWDDAQLSKVNAQADLVYEDFTKKVAEGRNLALGRVQEIARGRVWTGADAKERGLVDELGGFWTAVDNAKKLANIAPATRVAFKEFPASQGLFGRVSRLIDGSSTLLKAAAGLHAVLESAPVKALLVAGTRMPDGRAQLLATGLPE